MAKPLFRAQLPRAEAGQVIGLLGGSFDPAHEGHVAITRAALSAFGLDRVWWLVSPGNPLKSTGPASIERRMAQARSVMDHPHVAITDIEAHLGTRYTADTLRALAQAYPKVRFVWLMGTDNLATFHLWQDWKEIAARFPIGVLARPGSQLRARYAPAARYMAPQRLPDSQSNLLAHRPAPVWAIATQPMSAASSTAIRAKGDWAR